MLRSRVTLPEKLSSTRNLHPRNMRLFTCLVEEYQHCRAKVLDWPDLVISSRWLPSPRCLVLLPLMHEIILPQRIMETKLYKPR
jgi:hypothetical protein